MVSGITTIKPFKVSLHNLRIPILFKDCPLGVSERRRSRNECSDSNSISEQIHRPDCACQKPQRPEIKLFHGYRSRYLEKAHCIKDRVLLDDTCGNGGFFVKTKKQRGDME